MSDQPSAISGQPKNVKCYGQPEDCRGWRQFLVERDYCSPSPGPSRGKGVARLPVILWVGPETVRTACGHRAWLVHPSSCQEFAGIAPGTPVDFPICEKQGRFIE